MNRYVLVGVVAAALLIVAGAAQADVVSFFDVWPDPGEDSATVQGPPYPTPPVQVTVSHEKKAGMPEAGMTQTEIINVSLQGHMLDNEGAPARIEARGGGAGSGADVASFFDIFTEVTVPPSGYPADSFFDLFVELSPPEPGVDSPILVEPPVVTHADSFFDIFTEVSVPGGLETLHLHGAISPGQPASFFDVYYGLDNDCDSFFDIYIEISCDGPPMAEVPLVTMTMTGTFVPEPSAAALLAAGGFVLLGLRRMWL
jgi:hypothetical protein